MENNPNVQSFLNFGQDPANLENREAGIMYHKTIDGKDSIRVVYRPAQIHPWSHFSKRSETATIEFFETALGDPNPLTSSNQIWQVKESMNFVGMVGFVLFIISFATLMVFTQMFAELRAKEVVMPVKTDKKGLIWFWASAVVTTLFGAVSYQFVVSKASAASFAEQTMIFGIAIWAALCGLVSILIMFLSYKFHGKFAGLDLEDRGIKMPLRKLAKTILLAIIVIVVSYSCVFIADYFCLTDFRIWNVGIKIFNSNILRIALFPHALLFLIFYISFSVSNNSFNFNQIGGKHPWANNLILTMVALLPLIILLSIQYGTYFVTGSMAFHDNNAPMDIAQLWAFLIIIPGASVIDRMLYRVTKNPYLAGIITGVIVAIISCANTTTRLI